MLPSAPALAAPVSPGAWRAAAMALLATCLLLPSAAGAGADAPVGAAAAPTVRVLAWWGNSTSGGIDALAQRLRSAGASVVGRLPLAAAVMVDVPGEWRAPHGVLTVGDQPLRVAGTEDHSGRTTGRQSSYVRPPTTGADGAGVTVALVDTGVADVPDLAGTVEHLNVSGGPAGDGFGHGTFLAGVIAGNGAASEGQYLGAAPGARILDVQVARVTAARPCSLSWRASRR